MNSAIELLKKLISTPSFSGEEQGTAQHITEHLGSLHIKSQRLHNNVWVANKHFSEDKPTLLLCSHHDTVRAVSAYTLDPFSAIEKDGKLYGLGSNDAGGSLVCLLEAFTKFYEREDLRYNLVFAAVGEEECSGANGISALLGKLPPIDCAIIGEPTSMEMAVAEKALIVIDATCYGVSGHAAREEGENAIYKAVNDIRKIQDHIFAKKSSSLGQVKASVTMIQAGTQHNVTPDKCSYVIDIRTTDTYTNEEILNELSALLDAELIPRSLRFSPSGIDADHPICKAGKKLGLKTFGSPTLSDQALLSCPSVKIGPGDSCRSHTADEFVLVEQIEQGIEIYYRLLDEILTK